MSDSKQGKALARQRQRRRDEEIFPRRRRPDPVPLSFPQILRRAAAVLSFNLRLGNSTRCCLLQLLRSFSRGASPPPIWC
jgi:hypothetical protein